MSETLTMALYLSDDDGDVDVEVTYTRGWHRSGNRRGHPDNWTEDEGEPSEIYSVMRKDTKIDIIDTLPKNLRSQVQETCDGRGSEPQEDPRDDPDYYDDD